MKFERIVETAKFRTVIIFDFPTAELHSKVGDNYDILVNIINQTCHHYQSLVRSLESELKEKNNVK